MSGASLPSRPLKGGHSPGLIPPDLADDLPQILARLRQGEVIDRYETQRLTKDGTRLDIALTISPIRNGAGQFSGASTIAHDITARKQAEAELERRCQETALLGAIAQGLSASLDLDTVLQRVVTGTQGLCRSARAFLSLRDPGTEALVGRYESGAPRAGYVGQRLAPGQGMGAQVLHTGQPWRTADYIADPHFSKAPGMEVFLGGHLAMLAVPILMGGQVAGVLYVSNPVTQPFTDRDEAILVQLAAHAAIAIQNAHLYQQAQAEITARRQMETALAQEHAETQRFYHTVSHELKTPLTALREFVSILLDELAGPLADQQREYLEIAKESCDQMTRGLNDLLDTARADTGKLSVVLRPLALGTVVAHAVTAMALTAHTKGVRLRQVIAPQLPEVAVDAQRLTQVLLNLLSNAVKFTPAGGEVVVAVHPAPHRPGWVQVQVRDSGCGIAPEHLQHIFDRLYQVPETDPLRTNGLGLGLYISQELVTRHGGLLEVQSHLGHGSTFTFSLPAVDGLESPSSS